MIVWFARNGVAANLLMMAILLCGVILVTQDTQVEIFPQTESDIVSVNIRYPGATPEDVERGVITRVEEALQGVPGVDKIHATAAEGYGQIRIEGNKYRDGQELLNHVKTRLDAVSTFPVDSERPVIELLEFIFEVITVTISGDFEEHDISYYAEQVRDELEQLPGVSQLKLGYVREREINIEVSQDVLREYGLTIADVARAIRNNSLDLSAGNLRTSGGDILIRTRGQAYDKGDFDRIKIRSFEDGSSLRVRDVARVHDGFEEEELQARLDGRLAATIAVNRATGESAINIATEVRNYIKRKQAQLPQGMFIGYWDDNSKIVRDRLSTLVQNAVQGSILILLLLALFLHPRVAFWVFLGLPVSFSGTFIVMWLMGTSINIVSLFAFILVLGVVVDDAIITGENIYRHTASSKDGLEAAVKGTKEIAVPVTFGVATTMVAFLPMAFLEGGRASVFAQLPLVVIPALIFSWIESKLILPSHLRDFKELEARSAGGNFRLWNKMRNNVSEGLERWALHYYEPALSRCIRHRYMFVVFCASLLFLVLASVFGGWVRFIFFPRVQSEEVLMQFQMPIGSPYALMETEVDRIAKMANVLRDKYVDPDTGKSIIKHVFSAAGHNTGAGISGGGGDASGVVVFELVPPEQNKTDIDSRHLLAEWRTMIGTVPGAESVSYRAELGVFGQPLHILLSGSYLDVLKDASLDLQKFLSAWEGVFDLSDDLSDGKEELRVELLPEGRALGLTRFEVGRQVRQAFYGYEVQRVQRGRSDIRVKVRFPPDERRSLHNINTMRIRTPDGSSTPLSNVALLHFDKGPATITRIDRLRTVSVTADVDKGEVNMRVLQRELQQFLDALVVRYPGVRYRYEGEILEQQQSFGSISRGLLFTLVAIYCLLAIPLRSYIQPLIVMLAIPFSLIGVIGGHLMVGMELSVMSVLGCLALVGVVVNDSLVLVDFINKHRGKGRLGALRGIKRSGVLRLRPVILTSLTTFIGLLPLLFDSSTQAEFLKPMAISLGFGVLFASAITLFMVPIAYLILDDIKALIGRLQYRAAVDGQALASGKAGTL